MKRVSVLAAALALLCLGTLAQASITIPTVPVDDPGNTGELSGSGAGGWGATKTCGAVSYAYRISKFEITAAQYCEFLNYKAQSDPYGLWNPTMANTSDPYAGGGGCNIQRSGTYGGYTYTVAVEWANRPVNYVSYWDACRFVNWLENGQGDGDTETAAYTLGGYNGRDGRSISRNASATWCLPSEDEWYKAAYYKGNGMNAGYWDYPTQTDSIPSNVLGNPTDPGNNATYYDYHGNGNGGHTIGSPYYRTEVGAHENSESACGTFDQGGNVWEWTDSLYMLEYDNGGRSVRGGCFDNGTGGSYAALSASFRGWNQPDYESCGYGFRVALVPEPSSLLILGSGILALAGMIRRRK